MQNTAQERRQYHRLPISLTVRYTLQQDTAKITKEAVSKDISPQGILMPVSEPIPISARLNLEISAPELTHPISTEGKAVWIEEIDNGKLYNVGIVFIKALPRDSLFMQQYIKAVDLNRILSSAIKNKASDIHLVAEHPPIMRVFGSLLPLESGAKPLGSEDIKSLIYSFLNEEQIKRFEAELELDTSYMTDFGRFRVNIHKEKGRLGAAFRYIPSDIKSLEGLGLPPIVGELTRQQSGLILVTGPTGSGKSTTLAAMIDLINQEKDSMIISLEDPIEYVHKAKKSIIKQREIGHDSLTFVNALKHTLRQDVNVILVGEMRDLDSISIALTAAETGHLVLSTLHTTDAISTINRIIDIFPHSQQQQIKVQLAECLRGVVAQVLVPTKDKKSRVVATEVLVGTQGVLNLIRQGHMEQLQTNLQVGSKFGMHSMDMSLLRLYKEGLIAREDALRYAKEQTKFTEPCPISDLPQTDYPT